MQDRDVAGIIFAEDIRNMTNNAEDLVKVGGVESVAHYTEPVFTFLAVFVFTSLQYPFAFNVITPQKTYVLNPSSQSKRVRL